MEYTMIQPPDYLRNYVRYYWVLESNASTTLLPKTFGTIADGSPGIIFQQSDQGKFFQEQKELPAVFLYGQTTKYSQIAGPGSFRTIGVYFHPHALKSVFGFNAVELTDSCVDIDLVSTRRFSRLSEMLLNAVGLDAQLEILNAFLFAKAKQNNRPEDRISAYAVSRIAKAKGVFDLKLLQNDLHLTERSIERRFKSDVGISPKLLSRIFQFQAAMKGLRENNYHKLSDIAYENTYADQSHFIRAFKEFAGFTPSQYLKQSEELVENFPEMKR
ncbi:helix-turn-helix domain-containing protein [Pedobacter heparinus]|uniref:helix-turn-helix domain-containing protein n=1 Tax=Pedobacter heparinus TaxID=984 RepID=UPI00292DC6E5|nr:helix-turn-helix domain-containing protein [Pedobacter heparinus]